MGYRTVIMLNNDRAHEWSKDPDLGQKIMHDMNSVGQNGRDMLDSYGRVVECTHADTTTLAVLGGYTTFNHQSHTFYRNTAVGLQQEIQEAALKLVKQTAADMGYRLVKKTVK